MHLWLVKTALSFVKSAPGIEPEAHVVGEEHELGGFQVRSERWLSCNNLCRKLTSWLTREKPGLQAFVIDRRSGPPLTTPKSRF